VSDILKLAFEKASEVMSESEQEVFARWLLDALDRDDMRWDKAFAESAKKLEHCRRGARRLSPRPQEPLDIEKL
jgi:hypothetical protein